MKFKTREVVEWQNKNICLTAKSKKKNIYSKID